MYGYRKQLNLAWNGKGAWKKMYLCTLKSLNNSPFIWVKYIIFVLFTMLACYLMKCVNFIKTF